jgi:hypothetical protein
MMLAKIQVWTQPIWLLLLFGPFIAMAFADPSAFPGFAHFGGTSASGSAFTLVGAGTGAGVILSLIAQIGEQVDYLRFMPDKTPENKKAWWTAVITAGPGWVVLGALKQLGGAFDPLSRAAAPPALLMTISPVFSEINGHGRRSWGHLDHRP